MPYALRVTVPSRRLPRAPMLAGLLALLAACTGTPRLPPPSADVDETVLRNDLRTLSSDEYEGRRPAGSGEQRTVSFLTAQLRKLGLQPGNGQSYVQSVPMVEISVGGGARLSVSGRAGTQPLRYPTDAVIWTRRDAGGVALEHSSLVFAGFGIVAPELGWNDYAGLDVHGKTILVLLGDPGTAGKTAGPFKRNALSYYGRAQYKLAEAARQGAAGVLLVHDMDLLGYGWTAVVNRWAGPVLELAVDALGTSRPAVEGWLSQPAARGLFSAAGLDYDGLASGAANPGFKAIAMDLTVAAHIDVSVRRFESANVIAILPGGERKHEYVLYCAHWDGLGRDAAGTLLKGAEDDAGGVAGLLTLAQSFSRTRPVPQRSIVFAAFTGEAQGDRLGSRYYVAHPLFALDHTSAAIDIERLHAGGRTRDVMIFGAGNSEIEEYVRGAALLQGRELHLDSRPQLGRFYDSDALTFALSGVPALYAAAGTDDAARGPQWGESRTAEYLMQRYAQPGDTYAEDWNLAGAVEDLEMDRQIGQRLADTRRFPRWLPNSEFSATRSHALPAD